LSVGGGRLHSSNFVVKEAVELVSVDVVTWQISMLMSLAMQRIHRTPQLAWRCLLGINLAWYCSNPAAHRRSPTTLTGR